MMMRLFKHNLKSESGSIVTVLMAGVALLAALTFGSYQFISGPLSTTAKVNQNNAVKTQMAATSRSAVMDAASQTDFGDCDLDGYIEPRIWRDAAGKPAPINGGLLPSEFGMPLKDPWGLDYGYCAWDVGGNIPLSGETEYHFVSNSTENNSCAFKSDNTLWCWGTESYGELGNGGSETDSTSVPIQSDPGNWSMIGRAYGQTYCAIKTDGSAWCWGKGNTGALGNNTLSHSATPVEVFGGDTWQHITSGNGFSCGIKTDGSGWCWGSGRVRGDGTTSPGYEPTPQALDDGGATWKKISAGSANACGIRYDDEIYCWGNNASGRNGNGTNSGYQYSPGVINEPGPWIDIAVGGAIGCAVKADGSAWCWGDGQTGSLGDGVGGDHEEWDPVPVDDPDDWKSVNITSGTGCGVKTDDTGWCWGQNANGAVGDGTGSNRLSPVEIDGSYSWKYIAPGKTHTCGIQMDNTIWCWGRETGGQLGNGNSSSTIQSSPVQITGFTTPGSGCPEARLDGADDPSTGAEHTQSVMAVVSAGPDRTFSTTCNDYVDTTTNLIDSSGDDVVMRFTYTDAAATAGALWQLKTGDDTTAEIDKNLEIGNDISFDTPNGLIQAAEVNTSGKIDATGGLQLGDQTNILDGDCTVPTAGTLRFNTISGVTELCTGAGGWVETSASGGAAWPMRAPDGSISAPSFSFADETAGGLYGSTGGNAVTLAAPVGRTVIAQANGSNITLTNTTSNFLSQGAMSFINPGSELTSIYSVAGSDFRVVSNGGVQIGDTALSCVSSSEEGTIKYIEASDTFEYCDGDSWEAFQVPAGSGPGCTDDSTAECTLAIDRSSSDPEFLPENIAVGNNVLGVHGTFIPKSTLWSRTKPSIAASKDHSCAIKSDGKAYCWGRDNYGKLGNGSTTGDQDIPSPVDSTDTWLQIATGDVNTCGIKTDGTAWCWGEDTYNYTLGNGSTTGDQVSPSAVDGTGPWVQIDGGNISTCGIKYDGTAWCWGADNGDQLGNGTTGALSSPSQVNDAGPWAQISMGAIHACGVKTDGTGWCWGWDDRGEVGDGSPASGTKNSPVAINEPGPWKEIVAGEYFTCGIKSDGTLWCWGDDDFGQLANGSGITGDQPSPVQASDVGPWESVYLGVYHACGVKTNGSGWCWGYNGFGQLGLGTITGSENVPKEIIEPGPWIAFGLSSDYSTSGHTCGIKADGSIWCWGTDGNGELGNGGDITGTQSTPTLVLPPTASATPAPSGKTVFITSQTWDGNLGGLSGADAKCQTAASIAGLTGTYKAWLSTDSTSASSRFAQSSTQYKLVDGSQIASDWADLVDGNIATELDLDEYGNPVTGAWAWTLTRFNGTSQGGNADCADWTSNTSDSMVAEGYFGDNSYTDSSWTDFTLGNCSIAMRLYCFEQ